MLFIPKKNSRVKQLQCLLGSYSIYLKPVALINTVGDHSTLGVKYVIYDIHWTIKYVTEVLKIRRDSTIIWGTTVILMHLINKHKSYEYSKHLIFHVYSCSECPWLVSLFIADSWLT